MFFLTESKRVFRVEERVLAAVKKVLSQRWAEQAGVFSLDMQSATRNGGTDTRNIGEHGKYRGFH